MRTRTILALGLATLALATVATPATAQTTASAADAVVEVANFQFTDRDTGTPLTVIEPGDTVKWVWTSGCHSVTEGVRSGSGSPLLLGGFDSGVVCATFDDSGEPTTTFTVTFDEPGNHHYYCIPHPNMEAQIVVQSTG